MEIYSNQNEGQLMKSVNVKYYDRKYFKASSTINYSKKVEQSQFKYIHQQIASLVTLKKNDLVVDYGCGIGELSFLLSMKYNCKVIGIDYSKDAIAIANDNLLSLKKTKSLVNTNVQFIHATNEKLPVLRKVDLIYLADVIEHLYDKEIDLIFSNFVKWSNSKTKIVIHTDNKYYLVFIQPIFDFIGLMTGRLTIDQIRNRQKEDQFRHVNLTTPGKLNKKLKQYGFYLKAIEYPNLSIKRIYAHLGIDAVSMLLLPMIYIMGKLLFFLMPGFYAVFERNETTH